MKFYTHYYFRSNNSDWIQQEFTQFQGDNYGLILHVDGYPEESAQRLIEIWNRCGRLMKDAGYEYSLQKPLTTHRDSV